MFGWVFDNIWNDWNMENKLKLWVLDLGLYICFISYKFCMKLNDFMMY